MNLSCGQEIRVQDELALRFPIFSHPIPVLEYIKAISSVVGASHILAIFEEKSSLKVFFDDIKIIYNVVRSGMHVMGHRVRVDYVVPPGVKVVLSNIDPIVSNIDLMKLLSFYGTVVSPIICPPISDDKDYCHISYGVRYCYMTIDESIPEKLDIKCNGQDYVIKVNVCGDMTFEPLLFKSDECDVDHVIHDYQPEINVHREIPIPIVVSVESAVSDFNADVHLGASKLPIERNSVVQKSRPQQTLKFKPIKVTATSNAAKKIKNNVKQKWIKKKINKKFRRPETRGRKPIQIFEKPLPLPTSSDIDAALAPPLLIAENKVISEGPLNQKKLLEFIDECKSNRAPIEIAKKYLGSGCNDSAIHSLINQIEKHAQNNTSQSFRARLTRLCKILGECLNSSVEMKEVE